MSQLADSQKNVQFNFTMKEDDGYDLEEQALPTEVHLPSLFGIPLKYISLVTLAVQNSLLTILMHESRVALPPSQAYSAAAAVLLNELLKGSISLIIAFTRIDPPFSIGSPWGLPAIYYRFKRLGQEVFSSDCWKLSIPAILYVIQNNLQFVAASNLDAATFQVSYQMKILTTAAFSVLLLRKKLSPAQWLALFCLAIGVGVVQIQTTSTPNKPDVSAMEPLKGFSAVLAACFTSGLAGVYFEMVLKGSQADLWVRNVQLSVFSLIPALVPILFSQASSTSGGSWSTSLFHNFGVWAWATVWMQVLGGLVTAMVIKYSDNILKGFATSLSIVISFLTSVALFDFHITFPFILGSVIVLIATWLYNQPAKSGATIAKEGHRWSWAWNEKSREVDAILLSRPNSRCSTHELGRVASSSGTLFSTLSSLGSASPPLDRQISLGILSADADLDSLKKNRLTSSSTSLTGQRNVTL